MPHLANKDLFGWAPGLGTVPPGTVPRHHEAIQTAGLAVPFKIHNRTARTDAVTFAAAWEDAAHCQIDYPLPGLDTQEIGDCVSWGVMHVANCLQLSEIAAGEPSRFHPVYPPYVYWHSRMTPEGGNGQLRSDDGSLGSWAAASAATYGLLNADFANVPQYSGTIAKKWGTSRTIPQPFIDQGKAHKAKTIGVITTLDQLLDALRNRYWATIACMRGFAMELTVRDGRGWFTGSDTWPHQMSYLAVDMKAEAVFRMNSWGRTAHGHQPLGFQGGGWHNFKIAEQDLRSRDAECFTWSNHEAYEAFHEIHWAQPTDPLT